jgi:hypothetical protein
LFAAAALDSLPVRGKQSPAFKHFFESQLCDDFLCATLDHFAALLRVDDMVKARTGNKKAEDIPPPSKEEQQAAGLLDQTIKEVSTYYCYIIMQFSRYKAAQQDRIFFESFYEFATNVVCAAFPGQHRFRIEDEVGRILRTDTFNLTKRKNDSHHHTKMYFSSRELYVLRYAGDGLMGKKLLTALHPRRSASESVNGCVSRRSPLATTLVPSPLELAKQAAKETADLVRKKTEHYHSRQSSSGTPGKTLPAIHDVKSKPNTDKRSGARSISPIHTWEKSLSPQPKPSNYRAASKTVGGDVDLVRQRLGRSLPFGYS